MVVAGSYGKMGAAILSCKGALSAGAGLVTAYTTQQGLPIMQSSIPETLVLTDRYNGKFIEEIQFDLEPTVIGIGPGLGTEKVTQRAFEQFLKANKIPLVIDADALNILSKNQNLLDFLPKYSVLTPHPKELELSLIHI